MGLTAAAADSRIKAVATSSMCDMSRSMSRGYNSYTPEQCQEVVDYLSQQRWVDAENGTFARGSREVPFDADGTMAVGDRVLPETLPEGADPITSSFFDYYRTERGFHPRSINSTTSWIATTPMAFFAFPIMSNIDMLAPRPPGGRSRRALPLLLRGRPGDDTRQRRTRDRSGRAATDGQLLSLPGEEPSGLLPFCRPQIPKA